MKIKKILSAFLAAAVMTAVPICAYADSKDATFCFDNKSTISNWETFGSVEQTGLKYDISNEVKENGDGSMRIYESITNEIPDNERYGGISISADKVGLESFKGCTMQASVYFNPEAAAVTDKFELFSDGMVWMTSAVSDENTGWTKISLTVPANADNNTFGFIIPAFDAYEGDVCYVDNVIIYDGENNMIANMGDSYSGAASITVSVGTAGRVILIILLAVLIVGIIAGIGFVVSKLLKKFI